MDERINTTIQGILNHFRSHARCFAQVRLMFFGESERYWQNVKLNAQKHKSHQHTRSRASDRQCTACINFNHSPSRT